ncbi:DUF262 domain-containing protein [Cytophaga hutchinsonii]|uniref:DUF262 domain-containing protein n=1 Tax=Cytophaga hutchinsonii (strain ATCC 33406 / DSM 1761 / CIP 103989 / NBRC 15051 / NCIMB 9469 / D465) TaxID=269798 RepID=A0A6N4SV27_CYTH3|nr:DUF262 domain-containing protein [Cytophaga hutchinsonii]ABG60179.1 conserved hypothetical protein [Cytophaga hutchinsonii ATCC 33406]SFX22558.1 Protein of unknown function [Cytophaga hutchinsonii ATCC 33406]
MSNKIFNTSIVNLADLQKFSFTIPTYQRPYVWGDEQIEKLLGDFYKSYQYNKEEDYYIGTILTKENGMKAELIDGQQRFTTLWLIAFVFSRINKKSEIENFLTNTDKSLKMNFEIRTEVEDYFKSLLEKDKDEDIKIIESSEIAKYPYLKNIAKALVNINGIIQTITHEELKKFGDYIYTKVQLIKNTTPHAIDLNKLFSTINSAGLQLEQTDIVKANLLKCIDEKVLYSKIWEACENMNNFFERNVRDSFPQTDWATVDLCRLNEFDKTKFLFNDINSEIPIETKNSIFTIEGLTLEDCEPYVEIKKGVIDEKRESEEVFCRSVINFGQLLLHTYRLHLRNEGKPDFEGTFHVNRIIEIFKPIEELNDPNEIKRFFVLLWKVRFLFDKYIIKWISDVDTKTEQLELININKNSTNYYSRTKYAKSSMLMLQSVLYFTGDYLRQFWLTSYLGYLLEYHGDLDANSDIHLDRLEKIDNNLSLCKTMNDKEASLALIDSTVNTDFEYEIYLTSSYGTKFQHYWFQKLEFILWKNWSFPKTSEFENYRITSRNSVEHIYPQNPENIIKNPKNENEILHSFGNLVLLSVSQNSEYSNKSVDEKRSMFNNKNISYDTLKSYYIFQNEIWTKKEIIQHQNEMIELICKHYKK